MKKELNYERPQMEVVEIEVEQALLAASVQKPDTNEEYGGKTGVWTN